MKPKLFSKNFFNHDMKGILAILREMFGLYLKNFPKVMLVIAPPAVLSVGAVIFVPEFRGAPDGALLLISALWALMFLSRAWSEQTLIRIFYPALRGEVSSLPQAMFGSLAQLPGYAILIFLWSLIVGFGLFLLLIPGFIFLTWYFFVAPVFVFEEGGILNAFRRSREISHGIGMAVFGRFFAIAVLFVVGLIIFGNFLALVLASFPTLSSSPIAVLQIMEVIVSQLVAPLFAAMTAVLYNEARRLKM